MYFLLHFLLYFAIQIHIRSTEKNHYMAFEIINPHGQANIVFICEHASNHIPPKYENLGLDDDLLKLHIAWDIGISEVTKNLSLRLNAPAVLARFSRLLIDANRSISQTGLIPEQSDGYKIKANCNLSEVEREKRINQYYRPFHNKVNAVIQEKTKSEEAPLIINMHSFTPQMDGFNRPWQSGMLWNKDPRVANALKSRLKERGYCVGDNKPYSGRDLFHTMNTHGDSHGFPHVMIEIRQNEINTAEGIEKWSRILTKELKGIRNLPEMSKIKHFKEIDNGKTNKT